MNISLYLVRGRYESTIAMKRVKLSVILTFVIHFTICSCQISTLRYTDVKDCSEAIVGVPIKSNSALNEFTFCGKYSFKFLKEYILMSLAKEFALTSIWIRDFEEKVGLLYHKEEFYIFRFLNQTVLPEQWQHICFAVSSNQIKIMMNGELIFNKIKNISSTNVLETNLWFGGGAFEDEEHKDNLWFAKRRFVGVMTDVYLWNKSLEIEELTKISSSTESSIKEVPSSFSWNFSEELLQKTTSEPSSSCIEFDLHENNDLFKENSEEIILLEYFTDFSSANYLCQAYGGGLLVPKTNEDLDKVGYFLQHSNHCHEAYLGLVKSHDESAYDLDGEKAKIIKWSKGQPNGDDYQECITVNEHGAFNDENCFRDQCSVCKIPTKSMFILRGNISKEADIERNYFVNMASDKIEIRGFKEAQCAWNGTWKFGSQLKQDHSTYNIPVPPLGLQSWNNGQRLKFTQCDKDSFTCHTYGHCISMTRRCDGHLDCPIGKK